MTREYTAGGRTVIGDIASGAKRAYEGMIRPAVGCLANGVRGVYNKAVRPAVSYLGAGGVAGGLVGIAITGGPIGAVLGTVVGKKWREGLKIAGELKERNDQVIAMAEAYEEATSATPTGYGVRDSFIFPRAEARKAARAYGSLCDKVEDELGIEKPNFKTVKKYVGLQNEANALFGADASVREYLKAKEMFRAAYNADPADIGQLRDFLQRLRGP
ncbi:hypothetical protein J4423_00400 [Candidatus Pacearchaeota archaeon]|nr:hypothetical protein [Candidatus Pacearchaeota archaeon]